MLPQLFCFFQNVVLSRYICMHNLGNYFSATSLDNITWSELEKQNMATEKVYLRINENDFSLERMSTST